MERGKRNRYSSIGDFSLVPEWEHAHKKNDFKYLPMYKWHKEDLWEHRVEGNDSPLMSHEGNDMETKSSKGPESWARTWAKVETWESQARNRMFGWPAWIIKEASHRLQRWPGDSKIPWSSELYFTCILNRSFTAPKLEKIGSRRRVRKKALLWYKEQVYIQDIDAQYIGGTKFHVRGSWGIC